MKAIYIMIILSVVATSATDALLFFVKNAPDKEGSQLHDVTKDAQNKTQKENFHDERIRRKFQINDEDLRKELTESLDFVFELVTEKLKTHPPIWMKFTDESVVGRLSQNNGISKRRRKSGNQPNRRPFVEETSRQSQRNDLTGLRILHKRSSPGIPADKRPRFQNYDYFDYNLSANNNNTFDYNDEEQGTKPGSINVAAVPLRIVRNGALRFKRIRGVVAGSVPMRVAPILLTTDPEIRRSSNIRILLKGKVRFNFFEETKDLGPEIYLVQLVTASEFDIVIQPPRRNEKNRKVPENLRQKFETELDINNLQETIQNDISDIMRDILREENVSGSFYFDRH